jgi:hypothetical protein
MSAIDKTKVTVASGTTSAILAKNPVHRSILIVEDNRFVARQCEGRADCGGLGGYRCRDDGRRSRQGDSRNAASPRFEGHLPAGRARRRRRGDRDLPALRHPQHLHLGASGFGGKGPSGNSAALGVAAEAVQQQEAGRDGGVGDRRCCHKSRIRHSWIVNSKIGDEGGAPKRKHYAVRLRNSKTSSRRLLLRRFAY